MRVAVICLLLALCYTTVQGVVMGIDFGSEWMKVALVGPGFFDVILNEHSSRKTISTVGFYNGEMFVGLDAQNKVRLLSVLLCNLDADDQNTQNSLH
jgi:hypoxia up-regulated 1